MSDTQARPAVTGLVAFAAVMLFLGGVWQAFIGLVALFNDDFLVIGEKWVATFDLTTWGWVHLLLGVLLLFAGVGLLSAATWARIVAIIVAGISAIVTFFWLPYYPIWAVLIIAIDIFVIWAVAAYREPA